MSELRPRRCYYEVLGVSRDVNNEDLRRVYRAMALKFHPDKNRDLDSAAANQLFQEIQQAYEVLSDPQERAWYDAHREAILHWGGLNNGEDKEGCVSGIDLYPFFSSSCYTDFDEKEKDNFYEVYRKLFHDLYVEDQKFGLEEQVLYPTFGHADSEDHVWQNFYNFFAAYNTPRSYSWLDEYDTRQADNRRISRLMEKENRRTRESAKKERNELVRNLVKFVRKRDPRIKAFNAKLEAKKEENKHKSKKHREKQLQQRAQMLDESRKGEAKKEGLEHLEEALDRLEVEYDSEEENFCIVCNKQMRNRKAYDAHLKQKKHLEMVQAVKEALMEEDIELDHDLAKELITNNDEDEDESSKENNKNVVVEEEPSVVDNLSSSDEKLEEKSAKNKKKGRRKAKNATTTTNATVNTTTSSAKTSKKGRKREEESDLSKTCVVCKESFGSKNKLFAHLKETNHQTFVAK